MPVSAGAPAAVDGKDLPGHERGRVGSEKDDRASNFIGLADPTERNLRRQRRLFWGLPVKRSSMLVSIGPGATALTRTPKAAPSSAADLVMPSTACLLPT
jgi:hypothetical protein